MEDYENRHLICDICKRESEDLLAIQEFTIIDYIGGYGSVFGDGTNVKCNICQDCVKSKLGAYLHIKESE